MLLPETLQVVLCRPSPAVAAEFNAMKCIKATLEPTPAICFPPLMQYHEALTRLLVAIRRLPLPAQCPPNWTCPHMHPSRQSISSFGSCLASRNRQSAKGMSRFGCVYRPRRHSLRGRILIPAQEMLLCFVPRRVGHEPMQTIAKIVGTHRTPASPRRAAVGVVAAGIIGG